MSKITIKNATVAAGFFLNLMLSSAFAEPLSQGEGEAQAQAASQIEQHRQQAENQAEKSIVFEAVEVIKETRQAIDTLDKGQKKEALAAIERATGKTAILVARYPNMALLPVDTVIELIDVAPSRETLVRDLSQAAARAIERKNYAEARLFLEGLRSEINTKTYNLPLGLYPAALGKAARLLEQEKGGEARSVLAGALDTLTIITQITPLPILKAQTYLSLAEENHEKEKNKALRYLSKARSELTRAQDLGYVGKDPEYASLAKSIKDLEKEVKGRQSTVSTFFTSLKDKLESFLKRLSASAK